jgi:hypothetical protein
LYLKYKVEVSLQEENESKKSIFIGDGHWSSQCIKLSLERPWLTR